MDEERIHQYRLNMDVVMADLSSILAERGYEIEREPEGTWRVRTRWTRGAVAGQIGSALYSLVGHWLRESDC